MSEPENPLPDSSELSELKQECADLRRQTSLVFLALTVMSLTFTSWLFLQARRTAKDLEIVAPQEAQIREANKKEKPVLENILSRLGAYSQNHPEFAAILAKYPVVRQGTNAVAPSSAIPGQPLPTTPH
jgi:hypothetical protein